MKFIHKLIAFMMAVLMLGGGIALLLSAVSKTKWDALMELMSQGRILASAISICALVLALLYVITAFPSRTRKSAYLTFKNDNGEVSISSEAIENYVSNIAGEFPAIRRMIPRVIPGKGIIDIVLVIKIKVGPQVSDICETLQQRVRESVTSGLGISQVRKVTIDVSEIMSGD